MSDEIEQQIKDALAAEGITDGDNAVDKANEPEATTEETSVVDYGDREFTEVEQEQLAKGWDPNGVKSAEEFARAEPLYDKIKAQSKELKQTKRAVDELKALMQKQEALAYEKALNTLRQEKDEAILRGDLTTVRSIEAEEKKMNDVPQQAHPAVLDFLDKYNNVFNNPGYEEMQIAAFAHQRDNEIAAKGLNLPPEEHMKMVEEHMIKQFPDYFGVKPNKKSQAVEGGSNSNVARTSTGHKKYTFYDLSDDQKKVARDFDKLGVMKTEEYIKSLVELGELK